MPHPIFFLPNGIKLVYKQTDSPISHFGVLVNAGTRDEPEGMLGVAHLVEHTIFKGTSKRTSRQVIRQIENAGGDLNASTSKEETFFHASFLSSETKRIIELLADIFFNATFPEKEIKKEKDVVYEEIKFYQDSPTELIFDEFESLIFKDHPIGRNILETKKSIRKIQRNDIINFIKTNYTKEQVVLSYIGNIDEAKIKKYCNQYFTPQSLPLIERTRTPFLNYQPQKLFKKKNTSQTHLLIGNIAYSIIEEKRHALLLLTNLLGGQGFNSRLNLAIREKRGLAYTVEAYYNPFSDTGLFSIYLGCNNGFVDNCLQIINKEMEKVKSKKLGTLQLHYAKKQFLGQLAIANEAKLNEMLAIGRSAFYADEVETLDEAIKNFETIDAFQVLEAANEI